MIHDLARTARTTGWLYLAMAVTAALGFLVIRPQLFAAGDPQATLANLVTHGSLARVSVALELAMVAAQALTAAWFYRLFRSVNSFAAAGIAVFGTVNAIAVLVSAAMVGTAIQVSADPFGEAAGTVQVLYLISSNMWGVGALFFGLWLIPMGWCVLRSGWMPRALGWILMVGGVAYILSPFVLYLVPDAQTLFDAMAFPASIGEFWIVGYLLVRGVRRPAQSVAEAETPSGVTDAR
ncbi:DUF4386 domain-containing protein [Saccharothrix sp.]|uniref:DUF4386 domain-containing protein n=1 Tax=Saccharothrix sp. TaxID=1873460 RepID=UPI0028121181|nr:DUF4386 domain-containing protein [Saccharothrix sp.]